MIIFFLLAAHALCDYPLQGDFLARGKNHKAPITGVPWWQCLAAHSMIHGGAVAALTGMWWMGAAEAALHAVIDYGKCDGRYGFNADQAFHILCKALWAAITIALTAAA